MYIIFLGAPGAGKGTQAARVAEKLNLVPIATGDLFRQAIEQGTDLGNKAKSYTEQGKLVPDEITIQLVLSRITEPGSPTGIIFDGFPRNQKQAEALDLALSRQGKMINSVVYIKVAEEELIKRLGGRWICRQCQAPYHVSHPRDVGKCGKCGGELYQRPDDKLSTVRKRLKVYAAETAPLIDYYTQGGKLVEVDGEAAEDIVTKRIIAALRNKEAAVPVVH